MLVHRLRENISQTPGRVVKQTVLPAGGRQTFLCHHHPHRAKPECLVRTKFARHGWSNIIGGESCFDERAPDQPLLIPNLQIFLYFPVQFGQQCLGLDRFWSRLDLRIILASHRGPPFNHDSAGETWPDGAHRAQYCINFGPTGGCKSVLRAQRTHTNMKEYFPGTRFDDLPAVPGRWATSHD